MFDASNIQHSSQLAQQQRINALNRTNLAGMWRVVLWHVTSVTHTSERTKGFKQKERELVTFSGEALNPAFLTVPLVYAGGRWFCFVVTQGSSEVCHHRIPYMLLDRLQSLTERGDGTTGGDCLYYHFCLQSLEMV